MKIIFLDIDGVLVTYETMKNKNKTQHFCPKAVAELNRITEATGAKIVLSSSWRIGANFAKINKLFSENGIVEKIHDFTPDITVSTEGAGLYMGVERHIEIRDWLEKHPEATSFVIIDDAWDARIENHYVRTTFDLGLHERAADKAIQILAVV